MTNRKTGTNPYYSLNVGAKVYQSISRLPQFSSSIFDPNARKSTDKGPGKNVLSSHAPIRKRAERPRTTCRRARAQNDNDSHPVSRRRCSGLSFHKMERAVILPARDRIQEALRGNRVKNQTNLLFRCRCVRKLVNGFASKLVFQLHPPPPHPHPPP